jgi:CRP-like cAMP-binding protein
MLDPTPAHPLLELDPDLAEQLSPERAQNARELRTPVKVIARGPWQPRVGQSSAAVGLLVLDGVIAREISIHDAPSAELFGPGDIIRRAPATASPQMVHVSVRWSALTRTSLALIDRRCERALQRYPEVNAVLVDRLDARAERLAVTQAISQITGVERRVEALLWHLAERWGRVGAHGIIVPLPLSHRLIGSLVGARRPTVTGALARLAEADRIARRTDGSWLLPGPPRSLPPVRGDAFTPQPVPAVELVTLPPVAA